ncbi:MAG: ABC transporter substrate-binding protein [Acidimicrobiia bacterium]|nr:ABC transporter substrate-binding protein [Acidimicrobiia bacterium]MXZ78152.1 ABC transporter substrate-binding protein [Acidimicrobiia bacterium]MYB10582.1 ABC transporter substrate-binding protein [Acidimicrobiia bacterium]MYB73880.1 ABC transporter substrate-binding protein [Acidimicrobiia bacterium]MYE72170.1 ABC transporter substrate-binding protein [Acidimicrobiia bacterium]
MTAGSCTTGLQRSAATPTNERKTTMRPRNFKLFRRLVTFLAVFCLVIAACGNDDDSADEPSPAVQATTAATAAATAAPASEPAVTAEPAEEVSEPAARTEEITIGAISTLDGPFAGLGDFSMHGVKLALLEWGGELDGSGTRDGVSGASVAGVPIRLVIEGSDATPDVAVEATRKMVEQDNADIIIGPLSGDEGLALKDYIRDIPEVTLVNGTSASQDLTLRDPAPNVFRFGADGAMWSYGVGTYAYEELGHRRIATIAEDYSYPYDQVGAVLTEFCAAGGTVTDRIWVPLGTQDYSSFIAQIPDDVDAVFFAMGGTDAINFVKQYDDFTGQVIPLIAGPTAVDQSVLTELGDRAEGLISSGPVVDDSGLADFDAFAARLDEVFPGQTPNIFNVYYYVATKSALAALEAVGGDITDGSQAFQAALAELRWDTPIGPVYLDDNRQAVVDIYLREVQDGAQVTIDTLPQVNGTLGFDRDEYIAKGSFSRDNPPCG